MQLQEVTNPKTMVKSLKVQLGSSSWFRRHEKSMAAIGVSLRVKMDGLKKLVSAEQQFTGQATASAPGLAPAHATEVDLEVYGLSAEMGTSEPSPLLLSRTRTRSPFVWAAGLEDGCRVLRSGVEPCERETRAAE
jgi:hypothetical protein